MALDAYDQRDEEGAIPLGENTYGPQLTFQQEAVCKMYEVMKSRQVSHDELFRMTDVSNDGGIDMSESELRDHLWGILDVLLSFGSIQEKEILAI